MSYPNIFLIAVILLGRGITPLSHWVIVGRIAFRNSSSLGSSSLYASNFSLILCRREASFAHPLNNFLLNLKGTPSISMRSATYSCVQRLIWRNALNASLKYMPLTASSLESLPVSILIGFMPNTSASAAKFS